MLISFGRKKKSQISRGKNCRRNEAGREGVRERRKEERQEGREEGRNEQMKE